MTNPIARSKSLGTDIVFSVDPVITAVGMVDQIGVMIAAVIIAVVAMMIFARGISGFIERHPTPKMLALTFLLLSGVNLIGEGLGFHIPERLHIFRDRFFHSRRHVEP